MTEVKTETITDYKKAFEEIAGARTIAFNTAFARLFGSVTAGLLLSQAAYYENSLRDQQKSRLHDKNGEAHLFFWHTDKQWLQETALSAWELRAAKKLLYSSKVLCSVVAGMPYETFYRVDFNCLAEQMNSPLQTSGFHLSGKEDSACLERGIPPLIKDKKIKETKKFLLSSKKREEAIEFSAKIPVSTSPDAEETFGKKAIPAKSKPKVAVELSPEVKEVRKSIKNFLAFNCFHARDEQAQATLVKKQHIQLNAAAESLQKQGITLPEVEAFWGWFTTGGDFRGTNYAKAEKQGMKTNVAPSVVNELWLAFKQSNPAAAPAANTEDNFLSENYVCGAVEASFEMLAMTEGINLGDENYETLKTNYLGSNPTAAKLAEVHAYEQI